MNTTNVVILVALLTPHVCTNTCDQQPAIQNYPTYPVPTSRPISPAQSDPAPEQQVSSPQQPTPESLSEKPYDCAAPKQLS